MPPGLARPRPVLQHGPFALKSSAYVYRALLPDLLRLNLQEAKTSALALESVSTIGKVQHVGMEELHAGVDALSMLYRARSRPLEQPDC